MHFPVDRTRSPGDRRVPRIQYGGRIPSGTERKGLDVHQLLLPRRRPEEKVWHDPLCLARLRAGWLKKAGSWMLAVKSSMASHSCGKDPIRRLMRVESDESLQQILASPQV